ncbi:hypothetical protein Tco_0802744 [Tanacetum coccineum]|uniref:Uncharacterized protein n=1 Tax=Tanacetum coccineum TaxID=301880 RepID=A0ABQ5A2D8_9ASTR
MAPLPLCEQRHPFLRVQVLDFDGMPELMRDVLYAMMLMEHRDDDRVMLGGAKRHMSWREFILAMGLHTGEEMKSLGFARMMAHSIVGRSQAPKKVTVTNLFYLRGLDVRSVNISYLLARYLRRFAARRKREAFISYGQFIARLAEHFRLLTEERLQGLMVTAPAHPIIDMAELEVDVGGVAKEVLVAPGGGDKDEEIPQAMPPPPRTQGERIAQLEEEVHGMEEVLQGQREVLDSMSRNFSRFTTWTVTSLSRMMDRAGVTYTRYFESPVEYQRRNVRSKTGRPHCKEIDKVGKVSTNWKSRSVGVLKSQDDCSTHILAHKLNLENLPSKIS